MRFLVELIFIAILFFSVWIGYKKGLVMTVGSIVMIIIALIVGDIMSDTFSHEAIPVIRPFVAGYMEGSEGSIGKALDVVLGDGTEVLSADDAIELHPELKQELCEQSYINIGVYKSAAKNMATDALADSEQSGSITNSIVNVMCSKLTYYIGFILFFSITVILLIVIGNITNISFRLPNAKKLDTYGGAGAGLFVGFLFCCFAAWVLRFTGTLLPEDKLWGIFSHLFVKMNLFSVFLSV